MDLLVSSEERRDAHLERMANGSRMSVFNIGKCHEFDEVLSKFSSIEGLRLVIWDTAPYKDWLWGVFEKRRWGSDFIYQERTLERMNTISQLWKDPGTFVDAFPGAFSHRCLTGRDIRAHVNASPGTYEAPARLVLDPRTLVGLLTYVNQEDSWAASP